MAAAALPQGECNGEEAGLGSLLIRPRGEEPPRVIIREEVPERPTLVIGIQVRRF
jgi:hypothetical protein